MEMKKIVLFLILLFTISCSSKPQDNLVRVCPDCNIILISIDTLRADHLSMYGYDMETSPNMEKISKESIVFYDAYSTSSWTYSSHFSMFTGKYPAAPELVTYLGISPPFSEEHITLTQVLKSKGYKTVAFTGGGYVGNSFGFGRGFDKYISEGRRFENNLPLLFEWLEEQKQGEKFFLFLHGYNTHRPYNAPEDYKHTFMQKFPQECEGITFSDGEEGVSECLESDRGREYLSSQYDAEILYVDTLLGQIFEKLKQEKFYDNSIIIITSDHGEELLDHGNLDHIKTLYQELIKVPLIIKTPTNHSSPNHKVSNMNIFPTVLDLLNYSYEKYAIDGKSFFNMDSEKKIYTMTGFDHKEPRNQKIFALIDGEYKYIFHTIDGNSELYNINEDQKESYNLAYESENKELLQNMEEELIIWLEEYWQDKRENKSNNNYDEQTVKQLKSLGYIT